MRLAVATLALLAVAASRGGCGQPDQYDPCAGKVCGADCTFDPPCRSANPPCMVPSYAGKCSAEGACVPDGVSCSPVADCTGQACGTECVAPCASSDPCPAGVCDGNGSCVASAGFVCPPPPPDPCAGKACGDSCDLCTSDAALCPVESFAATACDPSGKCVTAGTFTCPVDPCAGKSCGELCNPCAPSSCASPVAYACDPAGSCVPWSQYLCYDACAGKQCGDPCSICDPGSASCAVVACVTACDSAGRCVCDSSNLCG